MIWQASPWKDFANAGKDMNKLLKSLDKAAELQQLVTVWTAHDSRMMCLSPQLDASSKVGCPTL